MECRVLAGMWNISYRILILSSGFVRINLRWVLDSGEVKVDLWVVETLS